MPDPLAQEALTNKLTGTTLVASVSVTIVDFNLYMESATLIVGFIAGLFACFFHIRRWYRDKYLYRPKKDEVDE